VQQQLALAQGLVVVAVRVGILRDVKPVEPRAVGFERHERLLEVAEPGPKALDLAAEQRDPGLERVEDVELEPRALVADEVADGGTRVVQVASSCPLSRCRADGLQL
jgi:hypothetical protein